MVGRSTVTMATVDSKVYRGKCAPVLCTLGQALKQLAGLCDFTRVLKCKMSSNSEMTPIFMCLYFVQRGIRLCVCVYVYTNNTNVSYFSPFVTRPPFHLSFRIKNRKSNCSETFPDSVPDNRQAVSQSRKRAGALVREVYYARPVVHVIH